MELAEGPKDGQIIENLPKVATEGQTDAGGLVDDNALAVEKDPQASSKTMADQDKDDVLPTDV